MQWYINVLRHVNVWVLASNTPRVTYTSMHVYGFISSKYRVMGDVNAHRPPMEKRAFPPPADSLDRRRLLQPEAGGATCLSRVPFVSVVIFKKNVLLHVHVLYWHIVMKRRWRSCEGTRATSSKTSIAKWESMLKRSEMSDVLELLRLMAVEVFKGFEFLNQRLVLVLQDSDSVL